jgi:hypothetical protein
MARRILPSPAGKSRSSTIDLNHKVTASSPGGVSRNNIDDLRLIQMEFADLGADTDNDHSSAAKYRLLSEALGNVINDFEKHKRKFSGVAPSREAYANKRQKTQEAREDALTRAGVVRSSSDRDAAWSRITVLAQDRPNQEGREDALTRAVVPSSADIDAAWARVTVLAQTWPNREAREDALSRITMLTLRPNTKANNAVVRNNTTRPKRLYTQVTTTATQSRLDLCDYPQPANGSFYLPLEVVHIMGTVDRKSRGATILEWIQKKLVPVGKSAVYECLSNARKGRPISDNWNMNGRRAKLTIAEIEEVGKSLRILRGSSSFSRKDAKAAFTKKHHENMELRGFMPIGKSSELSATTITNYMAILARSGTSTLG